jgi:hypothetical protein
MVKVCNNSSHHNLCFRCPKEQCEPVLLDPKWELPWECEDSLAHTPSKFLTPRSMWGDSRAFSWPTPLQPLCLDSRASSWPATLWPLCLGHEPKARVVTTSFCATCSFIDCCSTPFSSSNSWMHIRSNGVAPRPTCLLELQPLLLFHRNSTANVPKLYMSWIMECANCIFSWYFFPSSHSKNEDECNNDFTANNWIFSTLTLSPFSTFFLLFNFLTLLFPPLVYVYVHFSMLPSPLLLSTIFQLRFPHSCFCKLQNFKKTHFLQQMKTTHDDYFVHFHPSTSHPPHLFFGLLIVFKLMFHPWNSKGLSLSFFVSLVKPCGSMSPLIVNESLIFHLLIAMHL